MTQPVFQSRIRIISISVFVFASILIARLFFIQVIHKNLYAERADKQYATPSGDVYNRGSIFFSKKDGSLVAAATISSGFKLAINTKEITDSEVLYNQLDPYIDMDHYTFISRSSKKKDP